MEFSVPTLANLDAAIDGLITRLTACKEITGKTAEVVRLLGPPGLQTGEVVVVGLGNRNTFGQTQATHEPAPPPSNSRCDNGIASSSASMGNGTTRP